MHIFEQNQCSYTSNLLASYSLRHLLCFSFSFSSCMFWFCTSTCQNSVTCFLYEWTSFGIILWSVNMSFTVTFFEVFYSAKHRKKNIFLGQPCFGLPLKNILFGFLQRPTPKLLFFCNSWWKQKMVLLTSFLIFFKKNTFNSKN